MERIKEWKALDRKVIVVASQGGRGDDWAAYIGAVNGKYHAKEWQEVLANGTKLPQVLAKVIFPDWAKKYHWRD